MSFVDGEKINVGSIPWLDNLTMSNHLSDMTLD